MLLITQLSLSQSTVLGENCNLSVLGLKDTKAFLEFDRELRDALSRQDPAAVALLMRGMLRVNDSRGTYYLDSPKSLQLRFHEIFTPAVRQAVLKQQPKTVFCTLSGVMYGNGQLWVDAIGAHFRIKTINLSGPSPPHIAKMRKVEFVCETEKHRIIVDSIDERSFHYSAWNKPRGLTEKPDMELANGALDPQGSGPCRYDVWQFTNGTIRYEIGELESCGDGSSASEGAIGRLEVLSGDQTVASYWCY